MTSTKYAIRCSTEEQARECNIKKLKSWISPDIINFYRNKWYTIISYSEAKEKWLLGEVSKKETKDLTYEQWIERGRQIWYKEWRRDCGKQNITSNNPPCYTPESWQP